MASIVLASAGLVLSAELAAADCGPAATQGYDSIYQGPFPSHGIAGWNGSTNVVSLSTFANSLASGKCETTIFDWGVPNGSSHYDARALRVCQNNQAFNRNWNDQAVVAGIQKLGVCYATNNATLANSSCRVSTQTTCAFQVNTVYPNTITSAYIINANGSVTFHDSNPTSGSS